MSAERELLRECLEVFGRSFTKGYQNNLLARIDALLATPPSDEAGRDHFGAHLSRGAARVTFPKEIPNMESGPSPQPGRESEPVAWIEHHKGGDNLNWERVDHPYAKATPLYRALCGEDKR